MHIEMQFELWESMEMKRETNSAGGESCEVIAEERTIKRIILDSGYIPLNKSATRLLREILGFGIGGRSAAAGTDNRRNAG